MPMSLFPPSYLEKEQYAARIIRPRLKQRLQEFLDADFNLKAKVEWEQATRSADPFPTMVRSI